MSDYGTPSDEHFDGWQPLYENSDPVYPPYSFAWDIDEPEKSRGYIQDFWNEVKRLVPLFLNRMLDVIFQMFHPSGFGFFLMVLNLILVFRLTYPLFSTESTNALRVLDAKNSLIPYYGYLFTVLERGYLEEAELSEATRETLDEFRHYLGFDDYQDYDLDLARQSINRATAMEPNTPILYLMRASFTLQQLGDFDNAIKDYTAAINLDGTLSGAFLGRGYCFFRRGLYARALGDFDAVIRLNQDPRAYLARGVIYEHLGLYNSAINDYTTGIENTKLPTEGGDGVIWHSDLLEMLIFRRGRVHRVLEKWNECVADFEMFVEVSPLVQAVGGPPPSIHWNRAECLIELGEYEKALVDYQTIYDFWSNTLDEKDLSWVRDRIATLKYTLEEQKQE